jgi:hypothetical protein
MLIRHKGSHFWSGVLSGLEAGIAAGITVGLVTKPTGKWGLAQNVHVSAVGILGAYTGLIIGEIVGALSGYDEKHDLAQMTREEKFKILRDILFEKLKP